MCICRHGLVHTHVKIEVYNWNYWNPQSMGGRHGKYQFVYPLAIGTYRRRQPTGRLNNQPHCLFISKSWWQLDWTGLHIVNPIQFNCPNYIKNEFVVRADCLNVNTMKQITGIALNGDQVSLQYIPKNMHMVFALMCFVMVAYRLIYPYPPGLLHWHCGKPTIALLPVKKRWWI